MSDAQLSVREFVAATANVYPFLTVEADQWHEVGYFFDPVENVYAYYSIDRKDPREYVERFATAEELLAARGADEAVASWVDSFELCVEFDERYVYYPATRALHRFPVAARTTMTAEEALANLEGRPLTWLREQLS
ncbi:hypothetical protein [Frankia sp. AgKG'84/4]|uniref:hypothetical protein n=1 Tax=Frankia sp. AgKG'84/4 TaxID=573490 RepID=UPI00200D7869|nr:hypothetical protein [Frankia sp. AgKG'84/4]MCL9792871.1 hypothetical protein [Frankia sp. AgKG'84/4]